MATDSHTTNVLNLPGRKALRNGNAERQARWRERRNALAKAAETQPRQRQRSPVNRLPMAVAIGCAAVAATLLVLSLAHLSHGIVAITRCAGWEGFALAVGIDAGLIAAEAAQLVAGAAAARAIRRWANAVIVGTLLWSGLLNAIAFAASAEGMWVYLSAAFGCAVPLGIFALTRISVGLAQHR
jgi:hypothetical protein